MHLWRIARDRTRDIEQHEFAPGFGHALAASIVGNVFQALRLGASIWEHGVEWKSIHVEPTLTRFELEHGKESERFAYNHRSLTEVLRTRKIVLGDHRGLCDLFVPIRARGLVVGIIAIGCFWRATPTTADILGRWHWLSARQAHAGEREFEEFLESALATPVLEASALKALKNLLACLAALMAGEGNAEALVNRAELHRAELETARFAERQWITVREMVDERSSHRWQTASQAAGLRRLGLKRAPDAVLVALNPTARSDDNPVDAAVRRYGFQCEAVDLSRQLGGILSGRVGDRGVIFLTALGGSAAQKERKLFDLAQRVAMMARRRFGLGVHCGARIVEHSEPLCSAYDKSLAAAESALASGKSLSFAAPGAEGALGALRAMRRELASVVETRPQELSALFERYVRAVTLHCGFRTGAVQGQLDAAIECILLPQLRSGVLDQRAYSSLCETLDRAAGQAHGTQDLVAAYSIVVAGMAQAGKKPAVTRRDHDLKRAVDYLHQHFSERLPLRRVARVAGFAPGHFSRLFKEREKMTFEEYLRGLRLEQAKQLLAGSELDVARVGQVCGFGTPQYFSRVFRAQTGTSPREFRRSGPHAEGFLRPQKPDESRSLTAADAVKDK